MAAGSQSLWIFQTCSKVNFEKKYPENKKLLRVWAPQTIYDDSTKKYMLYFSLKYGNEPDRICYAYANKTFTDVEAEPKQLFFSLDNAACIDGDIVKRKNIYYLFFKTEDRMPGIKIAVARNLTNGYTLQSTNYVQQTKDPEGAGCFKLNDSNTYILMYDMYTKGRYHFTKTNDFKHFIVADNKVDMDFHLRHGTIISLMESKSNRLTKYWHP